MINSKQAHEDLINSGRKETLHRLIMAYMQKHKTATFNEIAMYYGVHDSVFWRRLNEVAKNGLIVKTDESRINKSSGKNIAVWKLV